MYTPQEWAHLKERTTIVLRAFDRLGRLMLADPELQQPGSPRTKSIWTTWSFRFTYEPGRF